MNSYSVKARALILSAAILFAVVSMERTSADPGKPVAEVQAAEQAQHQDQKASANGQRAEVCAEKDAGNQEPDDRSKAPELPTSTSESWPSSASEAKTFSRTSTKVRAEPHFAPRSASANN